MFEPPDVLGRADGPHGEVVLRRRGSGPDAVEELVVDGTFAMDSTETHSEAELGRIAAGADHVLVGGLGLGYTVAAVLAEADRADRADRAGRTLTVDVVELEGALVTWAREGRTPTLARAAADPRVRLHVGDVGATLRGEAGPAGPWDAILLDVDNGPDFLIHAGNASLYAAPALRSAYDRLAPGGVLAIWCQNPSPLLLGALGDLGGSAREDLHTVDREGRTFTYAIEVVRRPPT